MDRGDRLPVERVRATEGLLLVNSGASIPHAWWLGRLFVLAAFVLVLWRGAAAERRSVASALGLAAAVVVLAVLAALAGFDYVLPRHLLVAYLPLIAAIAVSLGSARVGRIGLLVAAAGAALGVAVTLSINANLAYQREDVRDVARNLGAPSPDRIVILQRADNYLLENGGLPAFQYYAPSLHRMPGESDSADEIELIEEGIATADLRATLTRLTRLGFRFLHYRAQQEFVTYELVARHPITVTRAALLRDAGFARADPLILIQ